MNFKDLEKELPILLGWRFHCLNRVYQGASFRDLRIHDECNEQIYLAYAPLGGYNLLLLIWGDNEDLVVNKMNRELELLLKDSNLLIDSVTPLCQKEISRSIEFLQTEYDRRDK